MHQQVQEAIRPQAVALAIFGGLAALALLVLAGQALAQLLDRSATQLRILRAMGMSRADNALATGLAGAAATVVGIVLAIGGALAVSPLAPVGPVRALDPARGVRFDTTVLLGGGLVFLVLLLATGAGLAWRAARPVAHESGFRTSVLARAALAAGLPTVVTLGASYALDPPPGRRRGPVRANLFGFRGGGHRRGHGRAVRGQPERRRLQSRPLRVELGCAHPVPGWLRQLPRNQRDQAGRRAAWRDGLVNLWVRAAPDRRPIRSGARPGRPPGLSRAADGDRARARRHQPGRIPGRRPCASSGCTSATPCG